MRIAGVIIAGGEARRLGGEKPARPFAGATLLDAVIARVRPQVEALALNLRADAPPHGDADLPVIVDRPDAGTGPLAGIVTALEWLDTLDGFGWLASFPADTPFLPIDLVARLTAAAKPGRPVVAQDGERMQNLCALWPRGALAALREGMAAGTLRSLHYAHRALGSIPCPIAAAEHAFFNVNTPADLAEARRIAAKPG